MIDGVIGDPRDVEAWRREIRAWLRANYAADDPGLTKQSPLDERLVWERKLFDAGLAAIHWPQEFGGRDADRAMRIVFQEEYELVGAPQRVNVIGLALVGPTIMQYGTPSQRERWIAPILDCTDIWCQGFSEPGAGSDLASLRTRAVRDGDEFVVNGQKVWTSRAHEANWIFALVRTDPSAPKHQGITFLNIDMRTPGVEVRPIRQLNGSAGFSEIFFTDVRVPVSNVIGEVNDGWRVAMATLGHERGVGRRTYVQFLKAVEALRGFAVAMGKDKDPIVREQLGRLLSDVMVYRHHIGRSIADPTAEVGSETSYNKLYWSEMDTRIHEVGMQILGEFAEVRDDRMGLTGATAWQNDYWYARASRIFAGTNQIQRNIIAERVLELPKEPRS